MHGDAADISASDFNFPGVKTGAHRQANLFRRRS